MRKPKFTDEEIVVDREIHNYLTWHAFQYDSYNKYYCFCGKNTKGKTIFMAIYNPVLKRFDTCLKVKNLDDFYQCQTYIKSYYQRKRYLQGKGLIK